MGAGLHDQGIALPAKVLMELREDERRGRLTPALRALRIQAALTGQDSLLRDYCRRNKITNDDEFHQLLAQQAMGLGRPFEYPSAQAFLKFEEGKFRLGIVGKQEQALHLDLEGALPLGLGIVGGTGMGKTMLLTHLAIGIAKLQDVGCWVFNIRDEVNTQLPGFTNLRITKCLPSLFERREYLSPEVQAARLADIVASTFYLLWSRTAITRILAEYYSAGQNPTLQEVRNTMSELKAGRGSGLTQQQVSKLVGVFDFLCHCFGNAKDLRSGFQPAKHADEKLVLLMNLGDQSVNALVIAWMMWTVYEYNIAHGHRDNLRTVSLVDESRYLLSLDRERQSADYGSHVLEEMICTQRSGGHSLVAATQTAFPHYFGANTATKVALRPGDGRFFHQTAASMGLSREQEDWAKLNLQVGQAVITTYKYNQPLLCQLDKPDFKPEPEKDRQERTQSLLDRIKQYSSQAGASLPAPATTAKQRVKEQLLFSPLVPGALALLKHAALHPIMPVTKAYEEVGVQVEQGNNAKKHLEENGLVQACTCRLFKGRGRQPVLLEPTRKGLEYLKQHYPGITPVMLGGRGGLEHRVHAHLAAQQFKKEGYVVRKEFHDADLGLESPGRHGWVAVEIANGNSKNLQERTKKNKQAGAERTIIITSTKNLKCITKQLGREEVEVVSVEEYLLPRERKQEEEG